MTTINISDKAYKLILKLKQKMEEERQKLVSMSEVVDALIVGDGNV